MHSLRRASALALLVMLFAMSAFAQTTAPAPVEIVPIKLSVASAYLLKSAKPILIDPGSPADMPALESALATHHLALRDIDLLILTDAHTDHAGLAAALRRASGARIVLGSGDVAMAQAGRIDDLKPIGLMARIVKRFFITETYEAFTPDIVVEHELDLQPWGVAGKVVPAPGRTDGATVVLLADGRAFVGDMILGGYLGGALSPRRANLPYFLADRNRNAQSLNALLRTPAHTFYLGHGGPVSRQSVLDNSALTKACPGSP